MKRTEEGWTNADEENGVSESGVCEAGNNRTQKKLK